MVLIFLFLGTISYFQIRKQEMHQLLKGYNEKLVDDMGTIDRNLEEVQRTLQYLSKNLVLQKVLLDKYDNYLKVNNEVRDNLETNYWFLTTSKKSYVDSLSIYSFKDIPDTGYFIYGASKLEDKFWYEDLKNNKRSIFYVENGDVFLVYPIFGDRTNYIIGAMNVKLDMDNIARKFLDKKDKYTLYFADELIYKAADEKPYKTIEVSSKDTDFHLIYGVDKISILEGTFLMLLIIFGSGIMIILITLNYSKQLKEDHENILKEKKRINYLEKMLLKAQISPHFLYNIMSMINWKAKFSGNEEISLICRELSDFYRTALNKGVEEITVREEIANIRAYINLKLRLTEIPFDYEIVCPKDLEELIIINFILQPIVENAILHGVESLEEGGYIKISAERQDDFLLFRIIDNGSKEIDLDRIFDNKKGYGIRNVHERIVRKYGDDCGLFASRENDETEFILKLRGEVKSDEIS